MTTIYDKDNINHFTSQFSEEGTIEDQAKLITEKVHLYLKGEIMNDEQDFSIIRRQTWSTT
jgi:hypothetical protein